VTVAVLWWCNMGEREPLGLKSVSSAGESVSYLNLLLIWSNSLLKYVIFRMRKTTISWCLYQRGSLHWMDQQEFNLISAFDPTTTQKKHHKQQKGVQLRNFFFSFKNFIFFYFKIIFVGDQFFFYLFCSLPSKYFKLCDE